MADKLQVNPAALHQGSEHVADTAYEAGRAFSDHDDGIGNAGRRGWIGASQQALQEVSEAWAARHAQLQERLAELSRNMADAALRYAAADGGETGPGPSQATDPGQDLRL
ncbi:type VII secretion target [Mycobacterium sp. pUA109]|uniref:WXG100 family type VII secretion target n=1 Tax=Mycobacterium sp. pUA109 TaxID=3238982 RepID=UPI00351BB33D